MSPRPSPLLFTLALFLPACADDTAGQPDELPEGAACPLGEPVRLATPPAGFTPAAVFYSFILVGDHLVFTFDAIDDPARTYWHVHRCGGPVEPLTSLRPGLALRAALDTPDGPVLYAQDGDGAIYLVDRLGIPGDDEPREIARLPVPAVEFPVLGSPPDRSYVTFFATHDTGTPNFALAAAGIGARTLTLLSHTGDPAVPARTAGETLVNTLYRDDHLLLHDDDGTVRRFDPQTGASTTLLTGVRHVSFSPDFTRAIWQKLGDDLAEPVYLRDLAAGTDLPLTVNDFAAQSWGRLPLDPDDTDRGHSVGAWAWTRDGAFAALIGPDDAYVAAVRTDTGAPLELPPHVHFGGALDHLFRLTLADLSEHVDALWDPATGDLRVWYRGPAAPRLGRFDDTHAEFLLPDLPDGSQGRLVRLDLATGATEELLPRYTAASGPLADAVYLYREESAAVPLPSNLENGQVSILTHDLAFADPATDLYTPIADNIASFGVADGALYYLDAHSPDPGVWAVPIPRG